MNLNVVRHYKDNVKRSLWSIRETGSTSDNVDSERTLQALHYDSARQFARGCQAVCSIAPYLELNCRESCSGLRSLRRRRKSTFGGVARSETPPGNAPQDEVTTRSNVPELPDDHTEMRDEEQVCMFPDFEDSTLQVAFEVQRKNLSDLEEAATARMRKGSLVCEIC